MNEIDKAQEILAIYRFYKMDGKLYNYDEDNRLDELFDAVVHAIDDSGILKPLLPQAEFVIPCRGILQQDRAWLQRFAHQDTRAFFLSDIYDFLKLFTGRTQLRVN
ncbi:hypothetical protein Sulku_1315 [Sulfuricurvum kujiense DSM 16994]|uniref:Uncharacterized protein n=1 Tax=Sulfuricurvum kujiense (strain ATCC BAA-921 / DSM 16994 / JCM 11577 / YK-1) TaxID=709032 RepID=E4TY58_SULKY|nr:hypothetical protein [Sulfuricurvum kujiense]ADR33978.1 hypothetical protein Sulku_1315 [Sulfuricurvum kujiense DSM 16994]